MGKGNIICSFASMSCNVRLGDFNVFNNRVSLGHDAKVGDFNSFMTAARISGDTQIGTLNFFGVSSVVLQGVKIGTGTTIGANSVIMRKTKDNSVYVGNPAKSLILFKYNNIWNYKILSTSFLNNLTIQRYLYLSLILILRSWKTGHR